MVYIVGSKSHAAKFLEEVVFFIGAFCGSQECYAIATVRGLYLFQSGSGKVESLVPRDLFEFSILAHEGLGEPVGALDEFMSIPALDTQFALVHGISLGRKRSQQRSVHDLQQHFTAASAIRASRSDEFQIHSLLLGREGNRLFPPGKSLLPQRLIRNYDGDCARSPLDQNSALRLASISEHAKLAASESRYDQVGPFHRGGHFNNQFQARLLRFLILVTVTSRADGIKVEPHKIVMILSRG